MEHRDKTDPPHETALEEIVQETRATSARTWVVTGVIVAVLLTVMYAVTTHRADEDAARHSGTNGMTQGQPGGA